MQVEALQRDLKELRRRNTELQKRCLAEGRSSADDTEIAEVQRLIDEKRRAIGGATTPASSGRILGQSRSPAASFDDPQTIFARRVADVKASRRESAGAEISNETVGPVDPAGIFARRRVQSGHEESAK